MRDRGEAQRERIWISFGNEWEADAKGEGDDTRQREREKEIDSMMMGRTDPF
jgi:hypothetical protein